MKDRLGIDDVTPEFIDAAARYLVARVRAEYERERIAPMDAQLLIDFPLYTDDGERITDEKDAYRMRDDQAEAYYAERQRRIDAMGYTLPQGHCPALVAEHKQVEAGWALVDAGAAMIGEGADFRHRLLCAGLDKYHKFIDLLVGLAASLPTSKAA